MLANKEKDFVKSLEHTLDKTKKENAVLKKQLHELELKVKQLEMEADFWKSKYNEIVDSMLKNSSSNWDSKHLKFTSAYFCLIILVAIAVE